MNEQAIRDALAAMNAPDGGPLLGADEVAEVAVEGDWAAIVIGRENASSDLLETIHLQLARAFRHAVIEVRAPGRVFRGGAGFGKGRHVIAVLGGKGGVGKSTVSVNLALTLAAMGLSVGLLDGDLHGSDVPHMLGVHVAEPPSGPSWRLMTSHVTPPSRRRRPESRYGIELMSVGFVVPERLPAIITGRVLVSQILRYLVFEVGWSADVLVIDAPPGTGEELQVMARELPLSGALFVTTPQDLAQMDAERTLTLLSHNDVPVIGLVQNMASLTCPHCDRGIDMYARSSRLEDAGVRVLGRIPFDIELSRAADQGRPLVLGDPRGPVAYEFARIGTAVRRWLAGRRA